ncbi:MAG TPA: SRPBCC family protein [Longimicrobiales bacterium]|nr:SRPBCC family protein [Longimicrobiales bacterium]
MLKKIGVGVVLIVVAFLAVVATRPAEFHIERSATVAAPAEVVFAQLNDLHRWSRWNPFEREDPGMKITYSGTPSGVGASYHYVGPKMGEGRMTLTESTPNERIAVRAEFVKPMPATNLIEFTVKPAPGGVAVTWGMSGRNSFVAKAISIFLNMDEMVGGEFEKGLAELKRVSEEEAQRRAAAARAQAVAPVSAPAPARGRTVAAG